MKVELLSQVSSCTSVGKSLSDLPDKLLDGLDSMFLLPSALPAPRVSHPLKGDYTDTTTETIFFPVIVIFQVMYNVDITDPE